MKIPCVSCQPLFRLDNNLVKANRITGQMLEMQMYIYGVSTCF